MEVPRNIDVHCVEAGRLVLLEPGLPIVGVDPDHYYWRERDQHTPRVLPEVMEASRQNLDILPIEFELLALGSQALCYLLPGKIIIKRKVCREASRDQEI